MAQDPRRRSRALLIGAGVVLVLIGGALVPGFAFISAVLLAGVLVAYSVAHSRPYVSAVLRLSDASPARRGAVLAGVGSCAVALLAFGWISSSVHASIAGFFESRQAALEEDARATEYANDQVAIILADAEDMLDHGEVEEAAEALRDALALPNATETQRAEKLAAQVAASGDADQITDILVDLSETDFEAFARQESTPGAFVFGHSAITDRAVRIAFEQIPRARELRAELARQRAEAEERRRQLAAAAAAEEERVRQEHEAAQEKRRLAEDDAAKKREETIIALREMYVQLLENADITIIHSASVRESGGTWTLTLTVEDAWHLSHKQIRLQDAQALWEAWAQLASPSAPESAWLSLVDRRGNRVGGSGAGWFGAGSSISVID